MTQPESIRQDRPTAQPQDAQPQARIPELTLADMQRVSGGRALKVDGFFVSEGATRPNGFFVSE